MTAETAEDGDERAVLVTLPTAFEAQIVLDCLEDAGVEAVAVATSSLAAVLRGDGGMGVAVQVRAADLVRARDVLREDVVEARAIDWEHVDLGQREDELPLHRPGRMPLAARVAWVIAAVFVLLTILGAIMTLVV